MRVSSVIIAGINIAAVSTAQSSSSVPPSPTPTPDPSTYENVFIRNFEVVLDDNGGRDSVLFDIDGQDADSLSCAAQRPEPWVTTTCSNSDYGFYLLNSTSVHQLLVMTHEKKPDTVWKGSTLVPTVCVPEKCVQSEDAYVHLTADN